MTRVHRIEVGIRPGLPDPRSDAVVRSAAAIGVTLRGARARRVYLIEGDIGESEVAAVQRRLLADPVTEVAELGAAPVEAGTALVEVHPLPGVMDPAAQSVTESIGELAPETEIHVSTGWRYDLRGVGAEAARALAERALANTVVQAVHGLPYTPASLPRGTEYSLQVRQVAIRELSDEQLAKLSREAHLFLSLAEMKAIQAEFRTLGRDPTDIEIETIAQTWSEHCVHKTLKSRITYRSDGVTKGRSDEEARKRDEETKRRSGEPRRAEPGMFEIRMGPSRADRAPPVTDQRSTPSRRHSVAPSLSGDPIAWEGRPGHTINEDGSITIDNLLKSTVAAATHELIADGVDWTLSVFKDNSGVIALDDDWGVCIKVETHNHPSAIEPYGGSATGIGGCIRDVMGTGLGARPIASTDVFCVANPGVRDLPPGTLHPRRVLENVVAGVRDYGNRMGIPTVSGAVSFDDRYIGNPLVFCGCVGLIPRDRIKGAARPGDRIIALGGRTGRDGIHGATFSSAELEHTAADEFGHAVQIGNAIEEKRALDAIMRARDEGKGGPLFTAITDCGAGGFSSAVGEMGATLGAEVHLDRAPLKYDGLSHAEIWISEAQERMVLAVPPGSLERLRAICDQEHVEIADLGHFGTEGAELRLFYKGTRVGALPMEFLHEGIPTPTREAKWVGGIFRSQISDSTSGIPGSNCSNRARGSVGVSEALVGLLAAPDIASKHWIIRQYDHEVQGRTVVKPLVGPASRGPGDASVIEPVEGTGRGIAISQGLQTGIGDPAVGGDPYLMALGAIDECVRNLVCVGADPARIAILDNFCWPSCEKPENLGALVRAAEGCYDGAKAYRTPFVSGKDSLNNQLKYTDPATGEARVIEIPPTLLITGLGIVPSLSRCVTMDAKKPGHVLMLIGQTREPMGGSSYQRLFGRSGSDAAESELMSVPRTDLDAGPRTARAVAELIRQGLVHACHDCSDGGLLVAAAEMLIASGTAQPVTMPKGTGAQDKPLDLAAILRSSGPKPGPPAGATGTPPLGLDMTLENDMLEPRQLAFAESPSRYLVEVAKADVTRVRQVLTDHGGIFASTIGTLADHARLVWPAADVDVPVDDLARAWLGPLDW